MGKATLGHLEVTVVDTQATDVSEKYQKVELYGKTALAALKAFSSSQFLSGRVANVTAVAKVNPTTQEPVEGYLGGFDFKEDAAGNKIEDQKERRYIMNIDRLTFKTTNADEKEYEVSKPVKRDAEGNVTNLKDIETEHGKTIGVKSIIDAMDAEGGVFLVVDKTKISDRDVWMIKDAKQLNAPEAEQSAPKPKYAITVEANEDGTMKIAGPEIKDSETLKTFIKEDLGGKWNAKEKAWTAPMPEGKSIGQSFYMVINKAQELGVTPSTALDIKDIAGNAPAGSSLQDAAAAVGTKGQQQEMKV